MKRFFVMVAIVMATLFTLPVQAERVSMTQSQIRAMPVQVYIDLSQQVIRVIADDVLIDGRLIDNVLLGPWKTSTGRAGLATPAGTFRSYWLDEDHRSSIYENAPMWNSVFIYGGIAIHETAAVSRLGRRASHGCIRLNRANSDRLYDIIERNGERSAVVVIRQTINFYTLFRRWQTSNHGYLMSDSLALNDE